MGKRTGVGLLAALLCAVMGCGQKANTYTGQVVAYGGDPPMLELAGGDGMNYGFVITTDTELIWEDRSAFEIWSGTSAVDDWDVFGCSMEVTVVPGGKTESADDDVDECVEGWYTARKITVTGVDEDYFAVSAKPVIYLYPETESTVSVQLDYKGRLTCTYPSYRDGWQVTAKPDGTLTDADGKTYRYLYWEGLSRADYDFSRGFCVAGKDTAAFLEDALARLGLTREEANEFIVYWLPLMQENPYNLIAFQRDICEAQAALRIDPQPDTLIRVFMAWTPSDSWADLPPQVLSSPARNGFTAVEWGGAQVTAD